MPASAISPLSRRDLLRRVGTYGAISLATGAAVLGVPEAALALQPNWRWCYRCKGLWYGGRPTAGRCPTGGGHSSIGTGNYRLKFKTDGGSGQDGWLWCRQCEGLHFMPIRSGRGGVCPGNGGYVHTNLGSGHYRLETTSGNDGAGGQQGWRWCRRCEGLWFGGSPGYGVCPVGGGHSSTGSGNYVLRSV